MLIQILAQSFFQSVFTILLALLAAWLAFSKFKSLSGDFMIDCRAF